MWNIEESEKIYHVRKWGKGNFDISTEGELVVRPHLNEHQISIKKVVDDMKSQGIKLPAVIRFHDILRNKVKELNETFREQINEYKYNGKFLGVYPVKVNQMREVVEEIVEAGEAYDFGLEAGSKPELLSVLAFNDNKDSLTILNGYKDESYLRLALLGRSLGRKIIIVVEKFSELAPILKLSKEMNVIPLIGLRTKMDVRRYGRWAESCGEKTKFGLTTSELIQAVELMRKHDLLDSIKLLHFHIGSQVSDIKSIKDAISEGGRIYAKLFQMGAPIEYFDAGGGLGVDYDGSKSTNDSSINYNLKQYVSDIIWGLKEICKTEDVPHPNIVTESGRALTAHHSCVITNVIGTIDPSIQDFKTEKVQGEHSLVTNLREMLEDILNNNNYQEVYNDAKQLKEQSYNAFKLGILPLEDKAKVETLYWEINKRIYSMIKENDFIPEGLQELESKLSLQYLCNFSVFQSAADSWAIDQLLPVVPITRLNEKPSVNATIADITCDSDGKINKFINRDGEKDTLPLHPIKKGEEYLIGIFLTGAYQDVMGDMHNLFGRLNEVHVYSDTKDEQGFYIEEIIKGNSASNVLSTMQYNPEFMAHKIKKLVNKKINEGLLAPRVGVKLVDFYEDCLTDYTYLS